MEKYTEEHLFTACKNRCLSEWEFKSLRIMQPNWTFVFRGKK